MRKEFTPPRIAELLLRCSLSSEDAEVIAGDLEETARGAIAPERGARAARRWYRRQVASVVFARAMAPADDQREPFRKGTIMSAIRQDLRYALRSLRQQPVFTAVAVLMLALGIGANVAIFSLVNGVLYKPLPFPEPDRLMLVHLTGPEFDAPNVIRKVIWSYPKYEVFRDNQQVFESTGAFAAWSWNMTGAGAPERVNGEITDASYFRTLGVTSHQGRTFTGDETRAPGSAPIVMLAHRFWLDRLGADPAAVGRSIGLNGTSHTIVGVMPPGFRGLTGQADLFVPITTQSAEDLSEKWNHTYTVVGRRKTAVPEETAIAAVKVLGDAIDAEIGSPSGGREGWSAMAVPLDDERADPLIRQSILILLAAVGSVLLIVCINLANLMLVRGLGKQREVAIRVALGASRRRIITQFTTESAVLAVLGAIGGLVVAYAVASTGAALMPDLRMVLPRGQSDGLTRVGLARVGLDSGTLLFTLAITAGAALLFGLLPAWRASRRDLTATIKAGSTGAVSGGTSRLAGRNVLMVGEMALALVLLTAGGLMIKSLVRLQATELGFNSDSVLSVRVALPAPQYNLRRGTALFDALVSRLAGHAEIDSVAFGSCAPLSGGCNGTGIKFLDRPPPPPGTDNAVGVMWASSTYFQTLGIRLVRGRLFTDADRVGQPKVVVINEAAAREFWRDEDPIGKRIGLGQGGFQDGAEIVGIVADVRYGAVERAVTPGVYLPLLQSGRTFGYIFVRSRTTAASMVSLVRSDVHSLDPDLPLVDVKLMDARFADATWRTRMGASLLALFATLALVLAAMGIYGVMSQGVQQRTREIGVRMALGAARADILRLIVRRVLLIGIAGTVVGVLLAVPAMRLLTKLLYEVRPDDPIVFASLALVLLTVTLLAGYIPARRATRVDPLITLRAE